MHIKYMIPRSSWVVNPKHESVAETKDHIGKHGEGKKERGIVAKFK